jgi:hypothetical protein
MVEEAVQGLVVIEHIFEEGKPPRHRMRDRSVADARSRGHDENRQRLRVVLQ